MWAGGAFGALVVSVAVFAVLNEHGTSREPNQGAAANTDDAGDVTPDDDVTADEPGREMWRHTFPESYSGPVWITVESPDSRVRTLTIVWGAWKRGIVNEGAEPVTYHFTKSGGPSIPVSVAVEPAATVTFGSGATPPPAAQDVNEGWERNDSAEESDT